MIIMSKIYSCPKCGSENIIKNGHGENGKQKFHCKDCNKWGRLDAAPKYSEEKKEEIMRSYSERASMRGVERIFHVSRHTLAKWLKKAENLPQIEKTLMPAQEDDILKLDELWSFVAQKANQKWLWIALCRRTRQVIAYFIGDRTEESCNELWKLISESYKDCYNFSDFRRAYKKVFPKELHASVGKETGQTSHVERWNNTLRQRK
jgi:IS1 family transposase/transposase-like protein